MITKIDIQKFGLFKDYQWKQQVGGGDKEVFNKINIIYGRNYSGKTTFSRVFKCLEDKKLHPHFEDARFTIYKADGAMLTHQTVANESLNVRVYNSDFIRANLSWLSNPDGSIKPFTILGEKNVEIDRKIKEIEAKLGEGTDVGLLKELDTSAQHLSQKYNEFQKKQQELRARLINKAQAIKTEAAIFNKVTYNITGIEVDIKQIDDSSLLSEQLIEDKKRLLKEEALPIIDRITQPESKFGAYVESTALLVSKKISPGEPLTELINNSLLQTWVRHGMEIHRNEREICAFCRNPLPLDLWEKLDAHFNEESEELRGKLARQIAMLENVQKKLTQFQHVAKDKFYQNYHVRYKALVAEWSKAMNAYSENLTILIKALRERDNDIFQDSTLSEIHDLSEPISALIIAFNQLIDENNIKTQTLSNDQETARSELRLSEVARFIKDIEYTRSLADIAESENEYKVLLQEQVDKSALATSLLEEKRNLEAKAQDETIGAELVNKHLIQFFGHDDIKLVAEGSAPNIRFKIVRDGNNAQNLSEGESSLISFCYFIAKIEDDLKDKANINNLIIYIDDPISSLDNNHIFFMFSLIDAMIAQPKKYGQLFISTHNLDFLKYLKRITINGGDSVNYFLVERKQKMNEKSSFLTQMPKHIREYITEFNYLFSEIYAIYKPLSFDRKKYIENTYNQFYNLPNNIRKFLECYLFYKYPNTSDPLGNLGKLFDGNVPSLLNRFINEFSHLVFIDRGWKPIDVAEAETCVKIIIDKIREKDEEQFNALVSSIS
ncbi:AAA family ATPase [Chitinophaga arvensicola]|uniref:Wobble nucleotide-excising tRNase n=1 Tax=Chitinophaga arvensicola TaxID=29529 RepID=A0A1I0SE07_9BACT|nr:AAA family ATPase [Chitinophaga arvensicola]SEW57437.1 Wobble nucleotide-excising tRNase [Chitinophaga arvensicola]